MIIILKTNTNKEELSDLYQYLESKNIIVQNIAGNETSMIVLAGDITEINEDRILSYDYVKKIMRVQEPYKLAGRKFQAEDTIIDINGRKIGGGNFAVIAGPCSIETEEQILTIAKEVKDAGAGFLRGGAFKPRTSPYSFKGLGLDGLELLKIARQKTGLPIVTEIMSSDYLDEFARDVDIIQIGARNMQNFTLLRQVGELKKPVLLKRGLSATIEELLMAAEHVMAGGTSEVIFCERGIRTFETSTRNTLDLSAIPVVKSKSHLPIIVDPSHAVGFWDLVESMAYASVAAGADGLIIEVHNNPSEALCDGAQSITPKTFRRIMSRVDKIREAMNYNE